MDKLIKIKKAGAMALSMILALVLSGCGIIQKAGDTKDMVVEAIFVAEVRTLLLDFASRAQLNPLESDIPSSVVLRVYQLADIKGFEEADYQTLLDEDRKTLAAELLTMEEVLLQPSRSVGLSVPLDKKAKYIGIAAFFHDLNSQEEGWKMVIERRELDNRKAKLIVVNHNYLTLSPELEKRMVTSGVNERNDR